MRRKLFTILILVILLITTSFAVLAGGDQVRGENGDGSVNQVQVMDPPPFQP